MLGLKANDIVVFPNAKSDELFGERNLFPSPPGKIDSMARKSSPTSLWRRVGFLAVVVVSLRLVFWPAWAPATSPPVDATSAPPGLSSSLDNLASPIASIGGFDPIRAFPEKNDELGGDLTLLSSGPLDAADIDRLLAEPDPEARPPGSAKQKRQHRRRARGGSSECTVDNKKGCPKATSAESLLQWGGIFAGAGQSALKGTNDESGRQLPKKSAFLAGGRAMPGDVGFVGTVGGGVDSTLQWGGGGAAGADVGRAGGAGEANGFCERERRQHEAQWVHARETRYATFGTANRSGGAFGAVLLRSCPVARALFGAPLNRGSWEACLSGPGLSASPSLLYLSCAASGSNISLCYPSPLHSPVPPGRPRGCCRRSGRRALWPRGPTFPATTLFAQSRCHPLWAPKRRGEL